MAKIRAPWTDEQVAALNRWQGYGFVHEFTCRDRAFHAVPSHDALVATNAGWICRGCNYKQDWAHHFMFRPQRNPADDLGVA